MTVHFPPIENEPNLAEPWVDVRLERAAVWGVSDVATGRARGWDAYARPVARRSSTSPGPVPIVVALR